MAVGKEDYIHVFSLYFEVFLYPRQQDIFLHFLSVYVRHVNTLDQEEFVPLCIKYIYVVFDRGFE